MWNTFGITLTKKPFKCIDNIVFKCHYRVTFIMLVMATALVSSRQYMGSNIKCTIAAKDKPLDHVVSTYCFFMSTYTVAKHTNKTAYSKPAVVHPGVGPHIEKDEVIWHTYYQWVPFVLFLQALSFYAPHWLWNYNEAKRIQNIVKGIDKIKKEDSIVKEEDPITKKLQDNIKKGKRMFKVLETNKRWAMEMIFFELLNLLNLFLQVFFTNLFLKGNFLSLGQKAYDSRNIPNHNPLDEVFPKVTKCAIRRFGPSGDIQLHDVICIMPLNMFNEKIFLTLWYWYIILVCLSVLGLVYRIVSIFLQRSPTSKMFFFFMRGRIDKQNLMTVFTHSKTTNGEKKSRMGFAECLFLRYIGMNMNIYTFNEVIYQMACYVENYKPKSRREQEKLKLIKTSDVGSSDKLSPTEDKQEVLRLSNIDNEKGDRYSELKYVDEEEEEPKGSDILIEDNPVLKNTVETPEQMNEEKVSEEEAPFEDISPSEINPDGTRKRLNISTEPRKEASVTKERVSLRESPKALSVYDTHKLNRQTQ